MPIPPGGTLDDYVPFYFTPRSPMLLNVLNGRGGAPFRRPEEITFAVTSIGKLVEAGVRCLLTDFHAYSSEADFAESPAGLDRIDWDLIRRSDFKRDPDDPGKLGRYQAEALVHEHVPVAALLGFAGATVQATRQIALLAADAGVTLPARERPEWYFR